MSKSPESFISIPTEFTGCEAQEIDLATAAALTAADRHQNPTQPHGYFFGREIIERILAQPGCVGLRIYFGVVPTPPPPVPAGFWQPDQRHLLLVGADKYKNDQLPARRRPHVAEGLAMPTEAQVEQADVLEIASLAPTMGIIAEMAIPCPNQCSSRNPLNSGE